VRPPSPLRGPTRGSLPASRTAPGPLASHFLTCFHGNLPRFTVLSEPRPAPAPVLPLLLASRSACFCLLTCTPLQLSSLCPRARPHLHASCEVTESQGAKPRAGQWLGPCPQGASTPLVPGGLCALLRRGSFSSLLLCFGVFIHLTEFNQTPLVMVNIVTRGEHGDPGTIRHCHKQDLQSRRIQDPLPTVLWSLVCAHTMCRPLCCVLV
jgi:hypothetical protein